MGWWPAPAPLPQVSFGAGGTPEGISRHCLGSTRRYHFFINEGYKTTYCRLRTVVCHDVLTVRSYVLFRSPIVSEVFQADNT